MNVPHIRHAEGQSPCSEEGTCSWWYSRQTRERDSVAMDGVRTGTKRNDTLRSMVPALIWTCAWTTHPIIGAFFIISHCAVFSPHRRVIPSSKQILVSFVSVLAYADKGSSCHLSSKHRARRKLGKAGRASLVKALKSGLQGRALVLKTPTPADFLSTACAPMQLSPDFQHTRRARMTRWPPEVECRDETTCLRPNVLTDHKVSLVLTRQKARHSKWNYSEHINQRQPTRNVRQTDATESHCCRTTKSAPIGTPLTPWRSGILRSVKFS